MTFVDPVPDPPIKDGQHGALSFYDEAIALLKRMQKADGTFYSPTDFAKPSDVTNAIAIAQQDAIARSFAAYTGAIAEMRIELAAAIASVGGGGSVKPAAPTLTSATPSVVSTVGQVSVAFTNNATGGATITDHVVRLYTKNAQGQSILAAIAPQHGASSPIVVTGITLNVPYTATVTAINTNGESPESAPSFFFTANATNPDPPTITSVTFAGTTATVFVTFGSDGGTQLVGITATATSSDGGTTRTEGYIGNSTDVTNLTNGKHYTFTATATSVFGTSSASAATASYLVGTVIVGGPAAKPTFGMFTGEPDQNGVQQIKINETRLASPCHQIQSNFRSDVADPSPQWGVAAAGNKDALASDGVTHSLGWDVIKGRVQVIADVPLAFGNQGQSSSGRITALDHVLNDTSDGTHDVTGTYLVGMRNYLRDRDIHCAVASGSNGVDISAMGGAGTIHTQAMDANMPTTGTRYVVVSGGGVVKFSHTGISGNDFTGCTYIGRCTVGGGSGATTLATGGYIGSGTGWPTMIMRLGWEFDGNWYPWGVLADDNPANQAALSAKFVATFKHVADNIRAMGWDSLTIDLTCDPTLFEARKNDVIAQLATTGYIESLGMDVYDRGSYGAWNSVTKSWSNPAAAWTFVRNELNAHLTIAASFGLMVSYGEWACAYDLNPNGNNYGGDNPTFIQGMFDWMNSLSTGTQTGNLLFNTYFDVFADGPNPGTQTTSYTTRDGTKPNADAKLKALFGT